MPPKLPGIPRMPKSPPPGGAASKRKDGKRDDRKDDERERPPDESEFEDDDGLEEEGDEENGASDGRLARELRMADRLAAQRRNGQAGPGPGNMRSPGLESRKASPPRPPAGSGLAFTPKGRGPGPGPEVPRPSLPGGSTIASRPKGAPNRRPPATGAVNRQNPPTPMPTDGTVGSGGRGLAVPPTSARRDGGFASKLRSLRLGANRNPSPALDRAAQARKPAGDAEEAEPTAAEEDMEAGRQARDARMDSRRSGRPGGALWKFGKDGRGTLKRGGTSSEGEGQGAGGGVGDAAEQALSALGASPTTVGRGIIKGLWSALWPSLGHTIFLIALLFYATKHSSFFRRFFPRLGEEWVPEEVLKRMPKSALIPIKAAETVAITVILVLVLMLDITALGTAAMLLALITSASNVF